MVRLLHLADAHLGARHLELPQAGSAQRERQIEAFAASLALAAGEKVDLVLVAGDLFDSNTPSKSVLDRVVEELRSLVDAGTRAVLIPGHADPDDQASIYRCFDLAELAGLPAGSDGVTVLSGLRPEVSFDDLGVTVHGLVGSPSATGQSPLAGFQAPATRPGRWQVGMAHAAWAEGDPDAGYWAVTEEQIASCGLDYLALGHEHRARHGRAGSTVWAWPGPPELVDLASDETGQVILVELTESAATRNVRLQPWPIGRTTFLHLEIDAATLETQDQLVAQLLDVASPEIACDVRVAGARPESFEIDPADVARQVEGSFLAFRLRDATTAPAFDGALPPPDTIAGIFLRATADQVTAAEAEDRSADAGDAREVRWEGIRVLRRSPGSALREAR